MNLSDISLSELKREISNRGVDTSFTEKRYQGLCERAEMYFRDKPYMISIQAESNEEYVLRGHRYVVIYDMEGNRLPNKVFYSPIYYSKGIVGDKFESEDFDDNCFIECAPGIHFL